MDITVKELAKEVKRINNLPRGEYHFPSETALISWLETNVETCKDRLAMAIKACKHIKASEKHPYILDCYDYVTSMLGLLNEKTLIK